MAMDSGTPTLAASALIAEKLAAFERQRTEFEVSFAYVQQVHGLVRFPAFPVAASVRYLHALWVCEQKDRLLSVPHTFHRYEGRRCLELLRDWQSGDAAGVVAFLQRKLDLLPFAALTREWQDAVRSGAQARAQRLAHGRTVLLNRGFNLHQALDAIFTPTEDELIAQVQAACAAYGHTPEAIERQLADLETPLYAYRRHPALAQRNMLVMNALGMRVTDNPVDQPGSRTWHVEAARSPRPAYAEVMIPGELSLVPLWHNNPAGRGLAKPPAAVGVGERSSSDTPPEQVTSGDGQ